LALNPYENDTDPELVAALLDGEDQAFEVIYFRYVKALTRYVRSRIRSKEDSFEIVQEVFESIWARHSELGHVTMLEAYLFRMVKYKIIRYFQHHQVVKKYEDHFKAFEMIASGDEGLSEMDNLRALINGSMDGLPERCRMAVTLRIDENLSNGDIAQRMNIDKSTVKRYMTSALNYFRRVHASHYKS
jgi:RNA polymerase sigma-70 factor (family 1)